MFTYKDHESYELSVCALPAITEKSFFFNISTTTHRSISKTVSTHMFSWSRIQKITLKKLYHEVERSLTKIMSLTSCVYVRSPPLRVIMSHFSGVQTITCVPWICSLLSWWSPVNSSTVIPYVLRRCREKDALWKL